LCQLVNNTEWTLNIQTSVPNLWIWQPHHQW